MLSNRLNPNLYQTEAIVEKIQYIINELRERMTVGMRGNAKTLTSA